MGRDKPERYRRAIEAALDAALPTASALSPELIDALRYATLGAGKRLRPALVCATSSALGGTVQAALPAAVAVELIHAYSLVHDDLPAMDDDDRRRGQPACHIAFDEATAVLVGDALQALAFETLAGAPDVDGEARARMVRLLAQAAGWGGMVGGQALDMAVTGAPALPEDGLRRLHAAKTGALFRASVQLGCLSAPDVSDSCFTALTRFGETIGTAFQIVDDVLDATHSSAALGKRAGADAARGKNTYPALFGIAESRRLARQTLNAGLGILESIGLADSPLAALALETVQRHR